MTDETYFNLKIKVEGDNVGINKNHNLKETLPNLPPAAGVYIATLILAIERVIEQDKKLFEVIELVCSPDEATRVKDALEAVKMLMVIDEMRDKMDIEQENGSGNGNES